MKNKKGVSIIILIITVIIMMILTGVGIQFFVLENPVDVTEGKVLLSNISAMQAVLDDHIAEIERTESEGTLESLTILDDMALKEKYFKDMPKDVLGKIVVINGKVKLDANKLTNKEIRILKKEKVYDIVVYKH